MNMFLGLMTDPFVAGRSGGGARRRAALCGGGQRLAAARPSAARDAYAKFPTKADVARNDLFDPRWSVWGAAYGGGADIDGNAALGSNTAERRAPSASRRRRLSDLAVDAGGFCARRRRHNFSVNGFGTGRSDLFQAGAFVRHTVGAAYVTGALAYGWQDVTTDRTVTVAGLRSAARAVQRQCVLRAPRRRLSLRDAVDGHHALCRGAVHDLRSAGLCRAGAGRHQRLRAELYRQGRHGVAHRTRRPHRQILCAARRHADAARPGRLGA